MTEMRPVENDLGDICWNAVVAGYPNRFEDASSVAQFCRQVAAKLERHGDLAATAQLYAAPALMGMLRFLWGSQNLLLGLDPEFAEGQAGALSELVKDLAARWSPPDREPWFKKVGPFPGKVDAALARIEALPYEKVYDELAPLIDGLRDRALALLDEVGSKQPDGLPSCAAFLTGIFVDRDDYSPLDGSVPEDIDKQLDAAYWALDRGNEARFFPYLARGFEAVRTRQPDELARWRTS